MKQLLLIGLLSFFCSQSFANEPPVLPVINKKFFTATSCANRTIFLKFRNQYSSPMYPLFLASGAFQVETPLTQVLAYALPRGDSPLIPVTFLEDKKGTFFGETYLIKKTDRKSTDVIEQKCEVASYCECKGTRCEVAVLTNGVACEVKLAESSQSFGIETNPFIIETR